MENKTGSLCEKTHRLIAMSAAGLPVNHEEVVRLSREIMREAAMLFPLHGQSIREEAEICLALLMAYNTSIYAPIDRWRQAQEILNRAQTILPLLGDSPLKVKLLTWCFAEVEDETLLEEARSIIASWDSRRRDAEQLEAIGELELFEENIQQ